jgi:hypothetical protein
MNSVGTSYPVTWLASPGGLPSLLRSAPDPPLPSSADSWSLGSGAYSDSPAASRASPSS